MEEQHHQQFVVGIREPGPYSLAFFLGAKRSMRHLAFVHTGLENCTFGRIFAYWKFHDPRKEKFPQPQPP